MTPTALLEAIVVNTLAIGQAIEDFALIHVFFGPCHLSSRAAGIGADQAYRQLQELAEQLDVVDDVFPSFRRTYARDFIGSVIGQAETFLFGRPTNDIGVAAATFLGVKLAPPFDLDTELDRMQTHLTALGYPSLADYQSGRADDLVRGIGAARAVMEEWMVSACAATLERLGPVLPDNVASILSRAELALAIDPSGPLGSYRHEGGYRGTVVLGTDGDILKDFLVGLLYHEGIPGHHFYYMLRRARQEGADSDREDALAALDTFYSPENVVNEGLAMNADIILGDRLPVGMRASLLVEKFLHKVFYNAWHQVNIEGRPADFAIWRLLALRVGMPESEIARAIDYHTVQARYYLPSYPLGIALVESILHEFGMRAVPLLYAQHSMASLGKVVTHLRRQAVPEAAGE